MKPYPVLWEIKSNNLVRYNRQTLHNKVYILNIFNAKIVNNVSKSSCGYDNQQLFWVFMFMSAVLYVTS